VQVVLSHGFGAPGEDLLALAPELCHLRPALSQSVRWVFPEGLLALPPAGPSARAWWNIDVRRWEILEQRDEDGLEEMRNEAPPGLAEAGGALTQVIELLRTEAPGRRLVLGGFSQGGMLSTEVGLRLKPAPDALLLFSSSLLNAPEWRRLAPAHAGLPVFQSHGREDPVLPFEDAERLRDLLQESGLRVHFLPFRGGHTLPPSALERAATLLAQVAGAGR
jgi:phospholipase/carboxylesterase